jgi:hypothetical protein
VFFITITIPTQGDSMSFINNVVSKINDARKRVKTSVPPPAYRLRHNAKDDHQICTFWVSEPILTGSEDVLSFRSPRAQERKQPPFVKELFAIKGVDFVEIIHYEIRVGKANIYSWKELIQPTEAVVRGYLQQLTTPPTPTKENIVSEEGQVVAQKWHLKGYDTFEGGEGAFYPLDGEFDDEQAAIDAARERLVELEKTKPSAGSGGQDEIGGIQDKVYIVRPDGSSYRFRG